MKAARIAEVFDVSLFDANLALLIMRGRVKPEDHPKRFPLLDNWLGACYNCPSRSEIKMAALDELLKTHGVEAIQHEQFYIDSYHRNIVATYLNTGETYATTIVRDNFRDSFRLMSYGDFVENLELRAESEVE